MLQAIRSKATSFVIKLLFGLLIVSFGVWGVGDMFRNGGTDTSVATVGGRKISAEQLNQAVRADMERIRGMFGGAVGLDQAKQFGIVDTALQRLVGNDLVTLEVDRLHLAVGDEAVRNAILGNPAFRNEAGSFDRDVYSRVLAANHLSGPQFETMLRGDIARSHLAEALTDGVTPPPTLVDALYRARAEKRLADMVVLPASAAGEVRAPTEEELTAYHDAHSDRFRTPELRSFTVALLRLDDVAAGIKVPDDKLRAEYDARADEFHTPEQRHLEQILVPDEAKAKEVAAALAAGKNFAAAGKEFANADPSTLDLGWVRKDELQKDGLASGLADAAFSLKEGETSQPLQSAFGWHVFRVAGIKPEETQPFDAVKDKLTQEVARDMAGDQIAKTANQVEDAIAGGASLTDLAQKFSMKTAALADVDMNGHDAQGQAVELPKPGPTILRTAFGTDRGQMSQLTEMGDDGYYLVQVEKVVPTTIKPLAEVREQAVQLWQAEQRSAALAKLAGEIADAVNGGKSLKEVAAQRKLEVTATPALLRTGGDSKVPPALVARIFEAKPGAAVTAPTDDSYAVAQLQAVQPADPAADKDAVAQLSQQLGTAMKSDMMQEFDKALRQHFPVEVNQANLDRAL
jgi:peptidyl-prolyl cis-trans isomerase D